MVDALELVLSVLVIAVGLLVGAVLVLAAGGAVGRRHADARLRGRALVGSWARVVRAIPSGGVGTVRVAQGGAVMPARVAHGSAASGAEVVVIELARGVLEVTPVDAGAQAGTFS